MRRWSAAGATGREAGSGGPVEQIPLRDLRRPKAENRGRRALITNPHILLADEPTGALDSKAADGLLRMFGEINREGQTILMVTHSVRAASHAGRVLFIKDGEVFHQLYRGRKTNSELYQNIADTLTMITTGGDRT